MSHRLGLNSLSLKMKILMHEGSFPVTESHCNFILFENKHKLHVCCAVSIITNWSFKWILKVNVEYVWKIKQCKVNNWTSSLSYVLLNLWTFFTFGMIAWLCTFGASVSNDAAFSALRNDFIILLLWAIKYVARTQEQKQLIINCRVPWKQVV